MDKPGNCQTERGAVVKVHLLSLWLLKKEERQIIYLVGVKSVMENIVGNEVSKPV